MIQRTASSCPWKKSCTKKYHLFVLRGKIPCL